MFNESLYKKELALMESGGNYKADNGHAIGKYQFIPSTLTLLENLYNLPAWDKQTFLNSPVMQEKYEAYWIKYCRSIINKDNLQGFYGRNVTGSIRFKNITAGLNEYGMLAGMHLAGPGSIKRYFNSGYNPNDGQTSLTDYMAYFSNRTAGTGPGTIPIIAILGVAIIGGIMLYYT